MSNGAPHSPDDEEPTPATGIIDLVAFVKIVADRTHDIETLMDTLTTRIEALQQRLTNAEYTLDHQQCPVEATIGDIRAVLAARWLL